MHETSLLLDHFLEAGNFNLFDSFEGSLLGIDAIKVLVLRENKED